jgi:hypothetical protein
MCAPERFPHAEEISTTAVAPIARPISARRSLGSGSAARAGEPGCSSSTVNAQAATMKAPRSAASMRYSGQCAASAAVAA